MKIWIILDHPAGTCMATTTSAARYWASAGCHVVRVIATRPTFERLTAKAAKALRPTHPTGAK